MAFFKQEDTAATAFGTSGNPGPRYGLVLGGAPHVHTWVNIAKVAIS
jgi:hypothetical protein